MSVSRSGNNCPNGRLQLWWKRGQALRVITKVSLAVWESIGSLVHIQITWVRCFLCPITLRNTPFHIKNKPGSLSLARAIVQKWILMTIIATSLESNHDKFLVFVAGRKSVGRVCSFALCPMKCLEEITTMSITSPILCLPLAPSFKKPCWIDETAQRALQVIKRESLFLVVPKFI